MSQQQLVLYFYMILIDIISSTAQEIASEKGTKIMEVIFSSIKASEYFYGRMAGIFAVILTHVSIYVIGAVLLLAFSDQISFVKEFLNANPNLMKHLGEAISFNTIAFITLSVFMFVVLSAFLGSMVTRIEDVGKAVQPVVMLIILGFLGVTALGNAGDTILLKVGSYIPFISTFFMPFRAINGYANGLEAWISFAIAFVFTLGMTVYIGRIYSSLILQTDDIGIWKSFLKALAYHLKIVLLIFLWGFFRKGIRTSLLKNFKNDIIKLYFDRNRMLMKLLYTDIRNPLTKILVKEAERLAQEGKRVFYIAPNSL